MKHKVKKRKIMPKKVYGWEFVAFQVEEISPYCAVYEVIGTIGTKYELKLLANALIYYSKKTKKYYARFLYKWKRRNIPVTTQELQRVFNKPLVPFEW